MAGRITINDVHIDSSTSRAVANGIGEKLRQTIGEESPCPDRLRQLLDLMRERESDETPANITRR